MKVIKSISANIVKLMEALSVLISSFHDVCSMAELTTASALKEQQAQTTADLEDLNEELAMRRAK